MRGVAALLVCGGIAACGGGAGEVTTQPIVPTPVSADTIPLRTLSERHNLRLGAAADWRPGYAGTDITRFRSTLAREFGALTPENDMKHERLHTARDVYRFETADSLVAFAAANGMRVRGHTLVWHRQLATWLTSGSWTAAEARTLLQEHVTNVAAHFRGKLAAWDVVNEALNDDGTPPTWKCACSPTPVIGTPRASRSRNMTYAESDLAFTPSML